MKLNTVKHTFQSNPHVYFTPASIELEPSLSAAFNKSKTESQTFPDRTPSGNVTVRGSFQKDATSTQLPDRAVTSSYLPASRQLSLLLCNGRGKRNQRSLTDRAVDTILLIGATLFWPVDVRGSLQSHIWWFLIIGFMMQKSDQKQRPACRNLAMCMNWGG